MFDNLRGVVHFKAHGDRLYAFIDEVRHKKVGCRRQRMENDVLYATCYRRDFYEIEEIAKCMGVEISSVAQKGAVFKAIKYRRRFGVAAGILIALAVIFYFSNVITHIEITGCETVEADVVGAALANCGIEQGAFIPSIDFDSCERKILLAIDDIAWVGIRHSAGRVVVDIHEMVEAPLMLDENTPCNIVAAYDAQIVDISVLEGVPCVQRGYTVKKGDILISGVQEGIKGLTTVKHSLGSVVGIYNLSVSFEQELSSLVRVETDSITQKNVLNVLSLEIPLYFNGVEFADYNLKTSERQLYLFGKRLPICINENEYIECGYIEKVYDEQQAQALLYEQKQRYEENFLENTEILSQKVNIIIDENKAVAQIFYTLKGEIGEKNEILFKNFN